MYSGRTNHSPNLASWNHDTSHLLRAKGIPGTTLDPAQSLQFILQSLKVEISLTLPLLRALRLTQVICLNYIFNKRGSAQNGLRAKANPPPIFAWLTKNSYYTFKWLGKNQTEIVYNSWKLHEIRMPVSVNSCWTTATPIPSHTVCGCFRVVATEADSPQSLNYLLPA